MTDSRNIVMPWPPSLNAIWRVFGGRVILSKSARQYINAAPKHLPAGRVTPLRGRLCVWLTLHPPQKLASRGQHWDIANREKLLLDVLTKQRVWLDDSQVDCLVIQRGAPTARGAAVLQIDTIGPPGPPVCVTI